MVDVMLVLLIIFMVITPMLQKGVSVSLAKTDNPIKMPEADKEDSLIVAVMRDGKIYFNSDVVTAASLTDKVKDKLANASNKRIFVKADAGARYGDVVAVVDDVRSAGVDQLGLLTKSVSRVARNAGIVRDQVGDYAMSMALGGGDGGLRQTST